MTTPLSSTEPEGHIVLFAYEAWGHTRPLCVLAERLIKIKPLHITFFATPMIADRVDAELSRNFEAGESHLRDLIRVVGIDPGVSTKIMDFEQLYKSFAQAYEQLVNQQPITCAHTRAQIKAVPSPDAVILDFLCLEPLQSVRKLSVKAVKVYAWHSASASFIFYPFAPESKGGKGDPRPKIQEECAKTGKSVEEVAGEVFTSVHGSIVRVPGLPPMYDHEYYPQEMPLKGAMGLLWLGTYEMLQICDGILVGTPEPFEAEAVAAINDWYSETSRSVHVVGPLLPIGKKHSVSGETKQSANGAQIESFLESTLKCHGPNSMLYISFGSLYWSVEPEKIWAFLDVVMDKKIPFIMSHASPLAQIPDDVKEKVKAYGLGLLSPWSPQQSILGHPVTSWFVTHAGQNSVVESISTGIPMICWPYHGDQPLNAAHLVHNLDVAYELFEVRTGHGLKEIHRIGKAPVGTLDAVRDEASLVVDSAFGVDGERKRANMKRLQEEVLNCWHPENGTAQKSLEAFVSSLNT